MIIRSAFIISSGVRRTSRSRWNMAKSQTDYSIRRKWCGEAPDAPRENRRYYGDTNCGNRHDSCTVSNHSDVLEIVAANAVRYRSSREFFPNSGRGQTRPQRFACSTALLPGGFATENVLFASNAYGGLCLREPSHKREKRVVRINGDATHNGRLERRVPDSSPTLSSPTVDCRALIPVLCKWRTRQSY